MSEKMPAPDSGVTVRMYNPGFGDCFLLAFRKRDGEPFYMLIDCGVHSQYSGGSDRIRAVVKDIRDATDGHLDVVVVTHEHADHVSGFLLGRETFEDEIPVDEVWFGWTEDPADDVARRLDKKKKLMLQGLAAARQRLAADGAGERAGNVSAMLSFFQVGEDALGLSTRDARDLIRDHGKKVRYLRPKTTPRKLKEVDDVRIFVLGPPVDEELLLAAAPTGAEGEVYEDGDTHMRVGSEEAFAAALGAADGGMPELAQPFARNHRVSVDKVKARSVERFEFFHRQYGFGPDDPQAWRRIDDDWLDPAESLALKLDSATNNTSLVLAIELRGSQRVLLFAGDAQVGNWKSWHKGGWSSHNGLETGESISAGDLLQRTVLYKVGHHGSHNATLRKQGLELMTSDELVAMIPVDETWALARKPHAWKMPFDPMYRELQERTRGRILRTDTGLFEPEPAHRGASWKRFKEKARIVTEEVDGEERVFYAEVDLPD